MDLLNSTGIPKPIYGVLNRWYNNHPEPKPLEFSATEVLKSSKQILLKRKHSEEVQKDVQMTMKSITGTWMHYAMSIALQEEENCIIERRFRRPLTVLTNNQPSEVEISGGVDLIYRGDDGDLHIIDYKNTNQAKIDKAANGEDTDFLDQMYIYAWLIEYELKERPVDATIVAVNTLLKSGEIDLNDPQKRPVQMLTFELDDMDYQENLLSKIKGKVAKVIEDKEEPCSEEEMWMSERKFGVKKPESTRYNKVCSSESEATQFIVEKGWSGKGYQITEIIPEPKKCHCYCDFLPWCKQGQEAVKAYEEAMNKGE